MTVFAMPCWFYDKKDLRRSPSIMEGLDVDRENRYRREGARFIINVGTKMGLRYDTMATGVVYFHRFYMFHSFTTFPRYIAACCCLFLAGKVEETPKKCKDIIRIAKTFLTDAQFAQFGDDPKEEVMTLERILLQTIKFDLQVDHPYGYLLKYAKCLKGDQVKLQNMVQMAWTFINDSLCTTLCLQWEPEVIAIALMYLAGKLSKFEVVDWNGRTCDHSCWWDMYVEGMSRELLEDICHQVLDLYSTPVPDTPRDSPPATPPTKSSIKKVLPVQNVTSPVSAPVSPVPPPKVKEVVGQPIPRLEPGELKRKVAKAPMRKDSADGKASRPASSTSHKAKKRRMSVSSPKNPTTESDVSAMSTDSSIATVSSSSSSSSQLKIVAESTYQSSVGSYCSAPTTDALKATMTQAPSSTAQTQYLQPYNRPVQQTFLTPEAGGLPYFSDGQASSTLQSAYVQNATYLPTQSQPPPPPLASSSGPSQTLTNIQPPHPNPAPYPEVYSSQTSHVNQVQPPQYPPPPQMHGATSVGQYPTPPPTQAPTNVILPNVSLPPPPPNPPPPHLSQPPPLPMPPSIAPPPPPRAALPPGMPPSAAPLPPVVLPPPSQIAPHHYAPRPEHDGRIRERPPAPRLAGPVHRPPMYFRDGPPPPPPPPPQDFSSRGSYEQDRTPHFRGHPDMEYEMDRVLDDRYPGYRDDYNCGPPVSGYGREYENTMPPFSHFPRGPPPQSPRMKNPPLMDTPTGIPPVRITGSGFVSGHPMS